MYRFFLTFHYFLISCYSVWNHR